MTARRRWGVVASAAVLVAPVVVVTAPAAAAAPRCTPSITVLPLPDGASSGSVTAAVPGIAVGTVLTSRRLHRAVEWRYNGRTWVRRTIPGLSTLPAGTSTFATGVNRHGAVTVQATPPGPSSVQSYVAAGGTLHALLDGVGGHDATAEDISDSGRVVGAAYSSPENVRVPVRWDYWDQPPRGLGVPATGNSSSAYAVDDNDDVAGVAFDIATRSGAAFRVDGDGVEQPLDGGPGPVDSSRYVAAFDLNASERTVGYAGNAAGSGPAIWDQGVLTMLPSFAVPGSAGGAARAVSKSGTVVGELDTRSGSETPLVPHVLLWTDAGGLQSLLPASARWSDPASATDVTDDGRVYGSSVARAGTPSLPTVWTCAARQAFTPTGSAQAVR